MAFRADEAAENNYAEVESYLIPKARDVEESEIDRSRLKLEEIACELGPAVYSYPSWHPLVRNHNRRHPITVPSKECGYIGLDHTRFFANGFITCPYGDGQKVIDSVNALPSHPAAHITAERLDVLFYNPMAVPILVKCNWADGLCIGQSIPLSVALPLLLENEVPCWTWSEVAETWDTMRPYFLGKPHGSRSSLFVSQEAGQAIKKIWEALINTGMYGPIKVDRER